jgi:hypothetical protein
LQQLGRVAPSSYNPPASDMQQFQFALETEVAKLGF